MQRYFHGFVSRFSAGGRAQSLHDEQAATSLLQRSGVSAQGIRQFLGGEAVANAGDRSKLAAIVGELLDLKQAPAGHAALLLPAVQSAREAARRAQNLQTLGLSAAGAQQLFAGLPVAGADDRRLLPQLLIAALGGALPAPSGGGYNQLTLDDTKGKEK